MDVITMGSTNLLHEIKQLYPSLTFEVGDDFRWSPSDKTVYVGALKEVRDYITLCHEVGHALANHANYNQDIELLRLEREAWTIAREQVAPQFNLSVDDELIEDALDSYREWLHARSICPDCSQNGIQKSAHLYICLLCGSKWRVNDARRCGLKRYRLSTTKTPA